MTPKLDLKKALELDNDIPLKKQKMKKRRAATLEASKVQKQLDRIQWETRQRIKPYRKPKEDG